MPKILIVVWRLSQGGGIPIVIRGLLERVDDSKFEVHLCTIRPPYPEDGLGDLPAHVRTHSLDLSPPETAVAKLKAISRLLCVARRERPDLVHVQGGTASYSGLAMLGTNAVKLLEIQDAPQSGRMSPQHQRVERLLARLVQPAILVHSRSVQADLASAWNINPESVTRLPLGIDTRQFVRSRPRGLAFRKQLGISSEAELVTYVARLVPEKCPELFLEAAAEIVRRCPSARFLLVGEGSLADKMRRASTKLGLDDFLIMPGFVEDLAAAYSASDIFLSTSRYEGFGLAVAEAMACGVPVVCRQAGGVEDVVGDAGILETAATPQKLAQHVLRLLESAPRRAELARAGRARAENVLDIGSAIRAYEKLYQSLVDRR